MGQVLTLCGSGLGLGRSYSVTFDQPNGEQALVLRVVKAPIQESDGARLSGFRVDEELAVTQLETPLGLEALSLRYKDHVRCSWPKSYRFQASRRSWRASVLSGLNREQACILQLATRPDDRNLGNTELDIKDASDAVSYAARFNQQQRQHAAVEGIDADAVPAVKVAAPVACEVLSSGYPSMIPVGAACTLLPYPWPEVHKYICEGSEDFLEVPQAMSRGPGGAAEHALRRQ